MALLRISFFINSFVFAFITLNNLEAVYGYFDEQGLSYADEIYASFLILFAFAGLPFINLQDLHPKIKGIVSMLFGCAIAVIRFLLLIFFTDNFSHLYMSHL